MTFGNQTFNISCVQYTLYAHCVEQKVPWRRKIAKLLYWPTHAFPSLVTAEQTDRQTKITKTCHRAAGVFG
jgi:hypothetical protein